MAPKKKDAAARAAELDGGKGLLVLHDITDVPSWLDALKKLVKAGNMHMARLIYSAAIDTFHLLAKPQRQPDIKDRQSAFRVLYGVYDTDSWLMVLERLTLTGDPSAEWVYKTGTTLYCDEYGRAQTERHEAQRCLAEAILHHASRDRESNIHAFRRCQYLAKQIHSEPNTLYVGHADRCFNAWLAYAAERTGEPNVKQIMLGIAISQGESAYGRFKALDDQHQTFLVATVFVLAKCYMALDDNTWRVMGKEQRQDLSTVQKRRQKSIHLLCDALAHMQHSIRVHTVSEYEIRACMLLGKLLWQQGEFADSRAWRRNAFEAVQRFERAEARTQREVEDAKELPHAPYVHSTTYRRALWLRRLPPPLFNLLFGQRKALRPDF